MAFCKICFQEFSAPSWRRLFGGEVPLCGNCFHSLRPSAETFALDGIQGRYLYKYTEPVRDLLFRYKACGDIELGPIFLAYQAPILNLIYRGFALVPAPSFREKDIVRGFNHVEEMFKTLSLPQINAIQKIDDVKQADLGYEERQRIGEHLKWVEGISVANKKVLFVDDLCTSGATAKACCRLLRDHGALRIEILVMGHPELKKGKEVNLAPP
jgi:competence protein ComFC